jgi:hypothetical protein
MRERVAAALQNKPPKAAPVQDPQTTLTPIASPWWPAGRFLTCRTRPRRIPGGRCSLLRWRSGTQGKPDRFNAVVTSADVRAVAISVATIFLDPTMAFASYTSRIVSIDDIKWRPNLDAAKQRARPGRRPSEVGLTALGVWCLTGLVHCFDFCSLCSDDAQNSHRTLCQC